MQTIWHNDNYEYFILKKKIHPLNKKEKKKKVKSASVGKERRGTGFQGHCNVGHF